MKLPGIQDNWPAEWQRSHRYDRMEIAGETRLDPGYASRYAERRRRVLRLVQDAKSPGSSVLDVAAGQGNFSLFLAEHGYSVTWNDLRSELQEYVSLKHEQGDITYAPGDLFELDFPARFDVVLLLEIIEHVAHPDQLLSRAASLLKPDGVLVLSTPNGDYFRSKLPTFSELDDPSRLESKQFGPDASDHLFLLRQRELADQASSAGLELVRVDCFNNPLTSGHMGLSAALRLLPRPLVRLLEAVSSSLPGFAGRRINSHMLALLRTCEK
jgi:2-polyprenyl-3-methyl-5-hydroxy-6-metoxy-1,4-benzoquinol methylase